jgi:uncharacterized membrane-anchored protein YhcB (DUF1043 family)
MNILYAILAIIIVRFVFKKMNQVDDLEKKIDKLQDTVNSQPEDIDYETEWEMEEIEKEKK